MTRSLLHGRHVEEKYILGGAKKSSPAASALDHLRAYFPDDEASPSILRFLPPSGLLAFSFAYWSARNWMRASLPSVSRTFFILGVAAAPSLPQTRLVKSSNDSIGFCILAFFCLAAAFIALFSFISFSLAIFFSRRSVNFSMVAACFVVCLVRSFTCLVSFLFSSFSASISSESKSEPGKSRLRSPPAAANFFRFLKSSFAFRYASDGLYVDISF
mmetsp:Transcript_1234/g.1898  ORF Transcript_1234/g.1898 Transcript_1234/m.1898 type:complete len:216 (-) Transcript_1234:536-1183(-)